MKLTFRGRNRHVVTHEHPIRPVIWKGTEFWTQPAAPIEWVKPMKAYGQIDDVALNGTFLVDFEFEEKELRSWLVQYVRHNPEDAVRLLSEMQGEVILALHRRPHIADAK